MYIHSTFYTSQGQNVLTELHFERRKTKMQTQQAAAQHNANMISTV